ncbi:hypothetical protein LWI28_015795 [Acer negundo]|uniref:Protein kinase domain-containing protein n=1 Tax=Acer negundo TaxID=4023 RepID=A0AAD5NZ91_ACENE|nr:hypothetical protein LWI28_015795 [Acer negundo]
MSLPLAVAVERERNIRDRRRRTSVCVVGLVTFTAPLVDVVFNNRSLLFVFKANFILYLADKDPSTSLSWCPEVPMQESNDKKVVKQASFQRLLLSDLISNPASSPLSVVDDLSNSVIGSMLHAFTLAELRVTTHNFARANLLGEGGFGPVYKGFVDDKLRLGLKAQPVAVKALNLDGMQGHREWMVIKLFKSLNSLRYAATLPWSTRMKIALGAAKGLAFLHGEDNPVIYRDFKTSNILLDADFTAKLSDFGLAKDGPEGEETYVTTRVMGTQGYAAPEYVMTGHLTSKSDVFSFGVVLLELLTGKRSIDNTRPGRERSLIEWARPLMRDSRNLDRLMDPRLEGQYSTKGAQKAVALAYKCLSHKPKPRPTMSEVVKVLESLQGFEDAFLEPFVYVAPVENDRSKERFDTKRRSKTEQGTDTTDKNHGRRVRRIKLPTSLVGYSDSALYKKLGHGLNSTKHTQDTKLIITHNNQ